MKPSLENIQPLPGTSFACLNIDTAQFDHHYHYHPEIEITWILESDGQRQVGDSIAPFHRGDLVVIGANIPHQYRNWQPGRARAMVIQFKQDVFGPGFFNLGECVEINRLFNHASRGLSFSERTKSIAQEQITALFQESIGPRRVALLLEILHTLSQDHPRSPLASVAYAEPINARKIDRLQRIVNYLEEQWQEPVTLAETAKIAALHPQSMSRFFQQHLGMTFQEYLIQLRLGRAARALLETDHTIAEIAFNSGFNNLANFNRHFHRVYQQTPSTYRRNC